MTISPRHSVSVAAAVVDEEDRVLAIKRADNGHWEPPGGVLELEESIEDGLRREVREETGLEVSVDTLTGVYKNMDRGIVALVFRCTQVGGRLRRSEEAVDQIWMTPQEIQTHLTQAYAVRLLDALSGHPTAIRSHDGTYLLDHPS